MKDFKVLKLLDKGRFLFVKFGVDYPIMRRILQLKLTLDGRRVPTALMKNNKKSNDEGKNSFRNSLLLYGFIGLFIAIFAVIDLPMFYKMNVVFGMIIFMVMTTMISDFSTVLLDVKDKNILLPRPIDPKTLNVAKVIHIVIYLMSITLSIAGPTSIAGLIRYGPLFFSVFILELVLICGLIMFFTSIVYYFVLYFFDGEKLKDFINYVQIVLSIFMMVAYQLMGRIFQFSNLNITYTPRWWHALIPTSWFAAPMNLFIEKSFTVYFVTLSIMGMVISISMFIIYIKVIVPYFERSLQKLNDNSAINMNSGVLRVKIQRAKASLVCFNTLENIFFRFTDNMLTNERKLKLKLYPSFAFAGIMPIIFLISFLNNEKSFGEAFTEIASGKSYLFLYVSVIMLSPTIMIIKFSEKYRGAWIYRTLPLENPVMVLKGVLKGYLLKYIVPVYIFISLIFLMVWGFKIIPDLILIFVNMILIMLIIYKFSKKEMPFYKDFQYTQDGSNVGIVILSFMVCGFMAVIHFVMKYLWFGVWLNLGVSLLLAYMFWYFSFRKVTWKNIIVEG